MFGIIIEAPKPTPTQNNLLGVDTAYTVIFNELAKLRLTSLIVLSKVSVKISFRQHNKIG